MTKLQLLIIIILIFLILILLGTIVFQLLFNLNFIDGLFTATLIMTGINIEVTPTTVGEKLFVIIYAITVVVVFLSMANVAVSYSFDLLKE